jgi:L-2-hydroxyglutarate oxidase LhgO
MPRSPWVIRPRAIVQALRQSSLAHHFEIQETPRALHQPYLTSAGTPDDEFWTESSGVFNTAELLVNQVGLNPNNPGVANSQRLQLLLNHYVESIERRADGRYTLDVTDAAAGQARQFTAEIVVLAAGSIESPKILRRSPVFNALPPAARA